MAEKLSLPNGSIKSRKFLLTLLALSLVTIVTLLTIKYATLVAILPTFIGGILGVLSLYFTGNIITKHVVGKATIQLQASDNEEEEESET